MKKLLILGLLCVSSLVGYAQSEEDGCALIGSPKYNAWIDKQTCNEICGVRFGMSYETALEILQKKFGKPNSQFTDGNKIYYEYKSYGGISFTSICFCFQRDSRYSYMNQCVMLIDCATIKDVKNRRDYIWNIVREKYTTWEEGTDVNGFKFYKSGISPKEGGINSGFVVDVVKYSKTYNNCDYSARLMYGPYNFVKEEF